MAQEAMAGLENENVVLRAGDLSLTLLPHLGGKIASIKIGDNELLQAPLLHYASRTQTMAFDESDASGWDECLPSVAPCSVLLADGSTVQIPDHGDLWRVQWHSMVNRADSVTYRGDCFSLPLRLERTVRLSESARGFELGLDYSVTNLAMEPTPWSWAAHPLFAVDPGDRIVLPDSIKSLRLEGSGGNRLGNGGDSVSWPTAKLTAGGETDLSLAQSIDSGVGDKLFAGPLNKSENWCALERLNAGVRIKIGIDPADTPYFGLWICYGGWPDQPGKKQMCAALEPATAPVDSLAETGPWSRVLPPGDCFSWSMTVEFESIASVN
jgi:galactose mutarotase-like enzyme